MELPLKTQQIDTLLSLLRVAADGELRAEQMRQRLGECRDFEPYETFDVLQAGWPHQKGALSSYSIHRWLQGQPCSVAAARLEDVAAMVMRYEGPHGELRYDNFLNMVLPKDPSHAWLKESILARSSRVPWQQGCGDRHISPEVSYRLCQLFENEIDVHKRLNHQQMNLLELGAVMPSICKFLDADQGICAGMGGLISPASLRRMLVNDLQALSTTECNALLRRINPSGSCLAPFHELAKIISLGQPWPLTNTLSSWPVRESFLEKTNGKKRFDVSGLSSTLALSPAPKLIEPVGPLSLSGFMDSSDLRSPSPSRVTFADEAMSPIKSPRRDGLSRSVNIPVAWGSMQSPRRIAGSRDSLASPAVPKLLKTYDTVLSPRGSYDLSSTLASTADLLSPRALSPRPYSARAVSPSNLSPRSTLSRTSSPIRSLSRSRDISSPLKDFQTPQRSSSQPTGSKLFSSPSPTRRAYAWEISSPAPSLSAQKETSWHSAFHDARHGNKSPRIGSPRTDCKLARTSTLSIDRRGSLKMVLDAVVQQAKLDVQVEQAKALIPVDVSLESIFHTLDRFHKGYIADTDFWSFGQQFGGQTSFGHLCVLLHEIQLRRPRDFSSVTGRLSFREFGSFLVAAESIEQEVLNAATSDEEARTMVYLLRNSEPCPSCGMRIQRDADAAGCPTVTCPICGSSFRCFAVCSDYAQHLPPLSLSVQYQLCRLLDTAALAAAEMESTRKQLGQCTLSGDVLCTLSAAFTHIADGRMSLSPMSLRRAFIEHDIFASEQELSMLRNRYLKKGAVEVTFAEFTRQLTPRTLTTGL